VALAGDPERESDRHGFLEESDRQVLATDRLHEPRPELVAAERSRHRADRRQVT
jgi:hypothetical protein